MRNTLITRKTILFTAFLYSFCTFAQQNETETDIWKGDTDACTISGQSITCNTDNATTIYILRKDTAPIEWEMNISLDKVSLTNVSYLYIYPILKDTENITGNKYLKIEKEGQNTSFSYREGEKSPISKNTFNIYIQLESNGELSAAINNIYIDNKNSPTEPQDTVSYGFALRFENMKNARISGLTIKSDKSEPSDNEGTDDTENNDQDNDEPDNDNTEKPSNEDFTQTAKFGDIIISEIMANPKGCPGYPEIEYIEIYNRTDSTTDLSGWNLWYGNSKYTFPESSIRPYEYLILSNEKYKDLWEKAEVTGRIDMNRFPTLANSGKELYLHDSDNNLITYTHYTDKRYNNKFKEEGGFSLERIDLNNINDTRHNWSASQSPLGGTPSKANSIAGKCSITERSTFLYHEINSKDTVILHFSSPLDKKSIMNNTSYESNDLGIYSISYDSVFLNRITLILENELQEKEKFNLSMNGIRQADGTDVMVPQNITISIPQKAQKGNPTFNEILFDSDNETCEYVELYNNSSECIELGDFAFATVGDDGKYIKSCPASGTNRILEPFSYIAFTSDTATIIQRWGNEMWKTAECNLPSLSNEGGTIALLDRSAETIDIAVFSPSIYPKTGTGSKGVAAEKVNPNYQSSNPANWLPATAQYNYGTPGKINSQYNPDFPSETKTEEFYLHEKYFSPDNDGIDDYAVINYSLDKGGYIINITIFDSNGREVACPVRRETLAEKGSIIWNGKDKNGYYLQPGIYIILIEAHHESGDTVKKKIAIAVN